MSEPSRDQFDAAGDAVGRPRHTIERGAGRGYPRTRPASSIDDDDTGPGLELRGCLLVLGAVLISWLVVGLFAVSVVLLVLGILGWLNAR